MAKYRLCNKMIKNQQLKLIHEQIPINLQRCECNNFIIFLQHHTPVSTQLYVHNSSHNHSSSEHNSQPLHIQLTFVELSTENAITPHTILHGMSIFEE